MIKNSLNRRWMRRLVKNKMIRNSNKSIWMMMLSLHR